MTALALLAGAGVGGGVMLVVIGLRGTLPAPRLDRLRSRGGDHGGPRRMAAALGTGVAVAALTRWPVGGVLAAVLAGSWHTLFGQQAAAATDVARIEAIAAWTEMLRDTMAAASGLEQAITATAALAPLPIRAEVTALAVRLDQRDTSLAQALPALADALADPTADLVVAALLSAAQRRAHSLGSLLSALATSAREEATMRMRVQAGRARVRTAARIVTGFTVGMAAGLVLLRRAFLAPYASAQGQLVLALVGVAFATGFWWLTKMARISSPERFVTSTRAPWLGEP